MTGIRKSLRPGDLGEIARLHGVIYHLEHGHGIEFEAYVAAGLAEFFHAYDPALDRVWICEAGDRIVGSLFLQHRDESAQLRYFLLLPEYRGTGLGKRLMSEYMQALDDVGYIRSFLWTTDELPAAGSLYIRHGFRLTESFESNRFGKALVEQKYEWTVP